MRLCHLGLWGDGACCGDTKPPPRPDAAPRRSPPHRPPQVVGPLEPHARRLAAPSGGSTAAGSRHAHTHGRDSPTSRAERAAAQRHHERGTARVPAAWLAALPAAAPLCHARPCGHAGGLLLATSSVGSHWPARARRISSVLVESMLGSTSTVKPGNSGDTASHTASAGQRMGRVFTGCGLSGPVARAWWWLWKIGQAWAVWRASQAWRGLRPP